MVLHRAQHTLAAPLGYIRTLRHPLQTSWLCIALQQNSLFQGKIYPKKKTQYIPKTKSSKIPTKENRFPNLLIKQPQILEGDKEFPDPKTQQNLREKKINFVQILKSLR